MNGAKPAPPSRYHAVSVANPAMRASISRRDVLPFSLPPRGLSRVEAAACIGVSPSLFDRAVKERKLPTPFKLFGRVLWCRRKLDAALDLLAGADDTADDPWGEMAL
jgi:hypothetical protein